MLIHNLLKITSRKLKVICAVLTDIIFAIFATIFAYVLRFDTFPSITYQHFQIVFVSCGIFFPIFIYSGLYQAIFRYSGLRVILKHINALLIYSIIFILIFTFYRVDVIPRSIGILQPLIFSFAVIFSRLSVRYWMGGDSFISRMRVEKRAIVYGAGVAGRQLASGINQSNEMKILGYLDDDEKLHSCSIDGLEIFNPNDLTKIILRKKITHLLLAIPSASKARRNEIFERVHDQGVKVLSLPALIDLSHDKVSSSDLKALEIEDLLGRDPVQPDPLLLSKNITNKVVLVTGAGGSIGSELCKQILLARPRKLLLVDSNEYALYSIDRSLRDIQCAKNLMDVNLVPLLANVQDEVRMAQIISIFTPQTIFHSAAFKHVPLVEQNPVQGILNNVWGTLNTAQQALEYGVENFVLISTDKAVRPTNIMGASKRIAEMALQSLTQMGAQKKQKTCFSMVRFGNVLGSSGSVVPLFRKQIEAGGPITVTHKEVTRYFMSIAEAAQLVIQASAMAQGGDVFLLDMGESVKIESLARKMIELSGLTIRDRENPDGDIEIKIIGMRPGEKLYEELLIGGNSLPTKHPRITRAYEDCLAYQEFFKMLNHLRVAMDKNDITVIREIMAELVEGYQVIGGVVDHVSAEESKLVRH